MSAPPQQQQPATAEASASSVSLPMPVLSEEEDGSWFPSSSPPPLASGSVGGSLGLGSTLPVLTTSPPAPKPIVLNQPNMWKPQARVEPARSPVAAEARASFSSRAAERNEPEAPVESEREHHVAPDYDFLDDVDALAEEEIYAMHAADAGTDGGSWVHDDFNRHNLPPPAAAVAAAAASSTSFSAAAAPRSKPVNEPAVASSARTPSHASHVPAGSTGTAFHDRAVALLQKHWGHSTFRQGQFELLDAVANHQRDSMVLMATGQGKSVCFQLLPLLTGRTVVVVSPLISLMQDQVVGMRARGINACALTSVDPDPSVARDAMNGKYALVYISPERFAVSHSALQQLEQRHGISAFAIDESHCISEWGNDFRAEYRRLGDIRRLFPSVPIMALTATATKPVCADIMAQLRLRHPFTVQTTFNRPNLFFAVRMMTSIESDFTRELVGGDQVSCIIYTQTKADTEKIAAHLQKLRLNAHAYHASLSPKLRKDIHEKFVRDEIRIIVATVAFGMGIDHAETRKVINYGMVKNLESLVQMTGRAGRDGQPAECVLFYSKSDYAKAIFWQKGGAAARVDPATGWTPSQTDRAKSTAAAAMSNKMEHYVNSNKCRRIELLEYFGEDWKATARKVHESKKGEINEKGSCMNCDNCLAAERDEQAMAAAKAAAPGSAAAVGPVSYSDIDTSHIYLFALAVHETGERFGLSWVAQFLRGSKAAKIVDRQSWWRVRPLANSRSHGQLSKESLAYIQALGRFLVNLGVLQWQQSNEYQILKLGPAGRQLLEQGESRWQPMAGTTSLTPELRAELEARRRLVEAAKQTKRAREAAVQQAQAAAVKYNAQVLSDRLQSNPSEAALLESLFELRSTISKETGVPPYTVFGHSELSAFAQYRPTTLERMAKFGGVTHTQMAQYGKRFCDRIREFCEQQSMAMDVPLAEAKHQLAAVSSALSGPLASAASFPGRMSYVTFLVRKRAARASDQRLTVQVDWHQFQPGSVTCISMPAALDFRVNDKAKKRNDVWADWLAGLPIKVIAAKHDYAPDKLGNCIQLLSRSMEDGIAYVWERFQIPDVVCEIVQTAVLKAEVAALRDGTQQEVAKDEANIGLWQVPFAKHVMAQIPKELHMDYGLLALILAHLRRLYGVVGPPHEATSAAPAASHSPTIPMAIDEEEEIVRPPGGGPDFSKYASQLARKQGMDRPLSTPTAAAASASSHAAASAPLPLPKRSLSALLSTPAGSAPVVRAAVPAVTSALVTPLYHLAFLVDPSRTMTKQKMKCLELFHGGKTVHEISQQLTLRTSTVQQFLADAVLHGYALDWPRVFPSEDESAIWSLLLAIVPADAMQAPMSSLIRTIMQVKKSVREECTKETILLVLNKFLQQRYLQQMSQAAPAATAAPAMATPVAPAAPVTPSAPMEDVTSSLPPLEHAPPIDLTSPVVRSAMDVDVDEDAPLSSISFSTPSKRPAQSFLADEPSSSAKKLRTDSGSTPAAASSAHTSPASNQPGESSRDNSPSSSLIGSKHIAAPSAHPIQILQSDELSAAIKPTDSPVAPVSATPPPAAASALDLSAPSIMALLVGSAGLDLAELGSKLIPAGPAMWASVGKLTSLLNSLAEDGCIYKQGERFLAM